MVRGIVVGVLFAAASTASVAAAQAPWSVFVEHGGRVVAVPIGPAVTAVPAAPAAPPPVTPVPGVSSEWGLLRLDGLPPGAAIAIDGRPIGAFDASSATWIALPPGPHFLDVALPGGTAIRVTVVVPVESSGYQVVPKP
jgi:hypothetical protein